MTQVLKGVDVAVVKVVVPAQEVAVELPPNWVRLNDTVLETFNWLGLSDLTDYVNGLVSEDLARLVENRKKLGIPFTEPVEF